MSSISLFASVLVFATLLFPGGALGVAAAGDTNHGLEDVYITLGEGNWINEACVHIEGINATLNRISCIDSQMGILGGGSLGRIWIADSMFSRAGIMKRSIGAE